MRIRFPGEGDSLSGEAFDTKDKGGTYEKEQMDFHADGGYHDDRRAGYDGVCIG